ncbi:MAG: hypothetical protein KF821_00640 [Anaerolineales bacterium]|nr:hypothetical protein [Anaerolineales bacterium]MBX3004318.1 hypothetical protein [Anaerolineales bacterium]
MNDNPYVYLMIIAAIAFSLMFLASVVRSKSNELYKEDFAKLHSSIAELSEGMQELRTKVAAIEKMLREVE